MIYCKACLATTIDGKITAPHNTSTERVKLGTPLDLDHLLTLRNGVDVICFGGSTCREWPIIRWAKTANPLTDVPALHVVFTHSWDLPWVAPLFKHWKPEWPPVFIASSTSPPAYVKKELDHITHWIKLDSSDSPEEQLRCVNHALEAYPHEHWRLEGGGQLMYFFLKARYLQEVYFTLTPQLIGGSDTPSLVSGKGFAPNEWPTVEWSKVEHIGNEVYLSGHIHYPDH